MKLTRFFPLTLTAFMASCASTHPGRMGKMTPDGQGPPLKVSADRQSDASDKNYTFLTFTFENLNDEIVRIKSTDILFNESDAKTSNVLVGKDLVSWVESYEAETKQRKHNKTLTQTALMIGGVVLGGIGDASDNAALTLIGAGAAVGGATWSLSSKVREGIRSSENPNQVPDQHVYASFSVPAKKFIRKWAVIQTSAKNKLKPISLAITFEDGTKSTYEIAVN